MNLPPKDHTPQEQIIAGILNEFGIRYDQGNYFMKYVVDFWIPEIGMVIEADGFYGHFKKRDVQRDMILMKHPKIEHILHIKDKTYKEIKETVWRALNKLEELPSPENNEPKVRKIDG